ncbi:hypothetical protein ABW19_dt0200269 [Dactylella cylindrospora]|nr:hypothetical protein ABW19_dt0200269 [Dactylella cylindrospora]
MLIGILGLGSHSQFTELVETEVLSNHGSYMQGNQRNTFTCLQCLYTYVQTRDTTTGDAVFLPSFTLAPKPNILNWYHIYKRLEVHSLCHQLIFRIPGPSESPKLQKVG